MKQQSMMVEHMASGSKAPGLKAQLQYLLSASSWLTDLTSKSLGFSIFKVKLIIVFSS